MTCQTCTHTATRGQHVYCAPVGACVCLYLGNGGAPSWCPGWAGEAKPEPVVVDEATLAFHSGKL